MHSLSVVLCTYNGARFLDAQLQSLRQQEGVGEIVAVDDGSTDDTMAILHEHSLADARLRIHRNAARLGVTRNFEKAMRLAKGRWVALSDQDDVWLSHKLGRMREAWDGRSPVMHHASMKFRGETPREVPPVAGLTRKFAGHDLRRLLYRNSVVGHTTVIRADVARALMPFPADVPHDWWIGVGGALHGGVQYLDEYLVHYRIHERNAYHPAGSRLRRLREEHQLRLRLLERLAGVRELTGTQRGFVRCYGRLLARVEAGRFPWRLWRFYLRHAPELFGGSRPERRRFTCWRKSLAAAVAAWMAAQGATEAGPREMASVEEPAKAA